MDFNIEIRRKQLENLDQFMGSSRDRVDSILEYLGWRAQKITENQKEMVKCLVNPSSHRIPATAAVTHVQNCAWRKENYAVDDVPLSEPNPVPGSTIIIDDITKINVLNSALAKNPLMKTGWRSHEPVPKTSNRLLATFTPDERLALYEYSVAATRGPPEVPEFNLSKPKIEERHNLTSDELKAIHRDARRRRIKYKSKCVHTNRKSTTEVLRDVIESQMEQYEDYLRDEQDGGSIAGLTECSDRSVSKERRDDSSGDRRDEYEETRSYSKEKRDDYAERSYSKEKRNDYDGEDRREYDYSRRDDDKGYSRREDDRTWSKREGRSYSRDDKRYSKREEDKGYSKGEDKGYSKREDQSYSKREDKGYNKREEDKGYSKREEDNSYSKREEKGSSKRDDQSYSKGDKGSKREDKGYSKQEDKNYSKREDDTSYNNREDKDYNKREEDKAYSKKDDTSYNNREPIGYNNREDKAYSNREDKPSNKRDNYNDNTNNKAENYKEKDYNKTQNYTSLTKTEELDNKSPTKHEPDTNKQTGDNHTTTIKVHTKGALKEYSTELRSNFPQPEQQTVAVNKKQHQVDAELEHESNESPRSSRSQNSYRSQESRHRAPRPRTPTEPRDRSRSRERRHRHDRNRRYEYRSDRHRRYDRRSDR